MSPSQESHAEPNNITNVEQPPAASTEIPSNDQQQSDAHAEARPESPHKTSKRKSHKKPKKKAAKKKGALPTHLQVIRDEIDSLKAQLNQAEAIAAKEEQERTDDERAILEKKYATSASVEHLEELFAKLNTPEMIQRSQQPQVSKRGLTEEQTITMLHFFYLVRLSQQGFFSLIANAYPGVQVEAVAYLCDKIVGNSLFPSTEASADVRRAKTKEVFDLLRKLHQGVDEPIGENFTMTYKAMRDMIHNLIDKALKQQQPQTNGSLQRSEESLSLQDQHQQQQQQQPVWVVVPFTSMMDLSSLQLPSFAVASSSQNETADSSKEVTASSPVSESTKDNTDDVEGEVASEQSTEVTEEDGSSEVDGFHSRNRGRGRGRGYNNRGFNRGRGRGDGARGGGSFRRGSNYRGRGFFRGPGRGVSWSPPSTSQ